MSNLAFTIGHANRPIEAFTDLPRHNGNQLLAHICTIPTFRRNPQDWHVASEARLPKAGWPPATCQDWLGGEDYGQHYLA